MEQEERITVAVVDDVRSWPALLALTAGAAIALVVHHNQFPIPDIFVGLAWVLIASTCVLAVRGSRRVTVYDDEIRVVRRGRERLRQRLADLVHIEVLFAGLLMLKFRDGTRFWWTPGQGDGETAANHIQRTLIANRTTRPGALP